MSIALAYRRLVLIFWAIRFWARYDLPPFARRSLLQELLRLVFQRHAVRRGAAKNRLVAAARRARELNASIAAEGLLHTMKDTSTEIDQRLFEVRVLISCP